MENNSYYHVNFFKFIYFIITRCRSNNSERYFKYYDLRKEIISEDFLYKLYFRSKNSLDYINNVLNSKNNYFKSEHNMVNNSQEKNK